MVYDCAYAVLSIDAQAEVDRDETNVIEHHPGAMGYMLPIPLDDKDREIPLDIEDMPNIFNCSCITDPTTPEITVAKTLMDQMYKNKAIIVPALTYIVQV